MEVNELVVGVNIALGVVAIAQCPSIGDGDGMVTVERLVLAVTNALDACGESPTPGRRHPDANHDSATRHRHSHRDADLRCRGVDVDGRQLRSRKGERLLRRAVGLAPDDPQIRVMLANLLHARGQPEEARMHAAVALDILERTGPSTEVDNVRTLMARLK